MPSLARLLFLVLTCAVFAVPAVSSALLDEADKKCRAPNQYESYENKSIFFPNTFQERRGTQIVTIRSLYQMPCEDTTNNKVAVKGKCEAQNVCGGKLCLTTSGTYEACKKTDVEVKETPNTGVVPQTNTQVPQQNTGVQAPINLSTDPRLLDVPSLQDPDSVLPSGSAQNVEEQLKNAAQGDGIWGDVAKWFGGEAQPQNIPISDAPGFDGNQIGGLSPESTGTSVSPEDWVGNVVQGQNTFTNTSGTQMEPDSFWSDAKAVAQAATQVVKETAQDAYDAVRSALDASPFQEPAPVRLEQLRSRIEMLGLDPAMQNLANAQDSLQRASQEIDGSAETIYQLESKAREARTNLENAYKDAGFKLNDQTGVYEQTKPVTQQEALRIQQAMQQYKSSSAEYLGDKSIASYNAARDAYIAARDNAGSVLPLYAEAVTTYNESIRALSLERQMQIDGAPDTVIRQLSSQAGAFENNAELTRKIQDHMTANAQWGTGFNRDCWGVCKYVEENGVSIPVSQYTNTLNASIQADLAEAAALRRTADFLSSTDPLASKIMDAQLEGPRAQLVFGHLNDMLKAPQSADSSVVPTSPESSFSQQAETVGYEKLVGEKRATIDRLVSGGELTTAERAFIYPSTVPGDAIDSQLRRDRFMRENLANAPIVGPVSRALFDAAALTNNPTTNQLRDFAFMTQSQIDQKISSAWTDVGFRGAIAAGEVFLFTPVGGRIAGAALEAVTPTVVSNAVAGGLTATWRGFESIAPNTASVFREWAAAGGFGEGAATLSASRIDAQFNPVFADDLSALGARISNPYVQQERAYFADAISRGIAPEAAQATAYQNLYRNIGGVDGAAGNVHVQQALSALRTEMRGLGIAEPTLANQSTVAQVLRTDEIIPTNRSLVLYEPPPQIPRTIVDVAPPSSAGGNVPSLSPRAGVEIPPSLTPSRVQLAEVPPPLVEASTLPTSAQVATIQRYNTALETYADIAAGGSRNTSLNISRNEAIQQLTIADRDLRQVGIGVQSAGSQGGVDVLYKLDSGEIVAQRVAAYGSGYDMPYGVISSAPRGGSLGQAIEVPAPSVSPAAPASPANAPVAPAPAAPSPIQRIVEPIRRAAVTTGLVTGLAFAPTHVEGAIATQLMERSMPLTKITTVQMQTGVKSELEQLLTQLESRPMQVVDATGAVPVQISGAQRLLNTINSALVNLRLPPEAGELYVHKITIETADLNPNLTSWAGARGIGQVTTMAVNELKSGRTPGFIQDFLTQKYGTIDNAWQLVLRGGADGGIASVDLGMAYVGYLYHVLGYRGEAIVAGYNGGPGGATRLINAPRDARGLHTLNSLVWETRNYVETIRNNITRVRQGLPPLDQSGGIKAGTALTEFLTLYRPQLASIPAPDLRVSTGPKLSATTVAQAPQQQVIGTFDAPVIAQRGPVFTVDNMPANWNPANTLTAEKVTPGPVELPKLQTADLAPLQSASQPEVVATGDLADVTARKTQIETQLSQAQTDLGSLQARVARAQNVQNGSVNVTTAQAGLDVLKSLWSAPNEQQKGVLMRGTQAASQLGRIVSELGNQQLGGQINRYVGTLRSLLVPANQTSSNVNAAIAQGQTLLQQTSGFLTNTGTTVDRNIAALRTQETQLKTQIQELSTSLAQIKTQEQQVIAQANVPQNVSAPVESIRPIDIETPVALESQPTVTAEVPQTLTSTSGQIPAPNQFQVAYRQFKDYLGPVSLRAYLSPLAPGVPLTPAAIQRVLRPRDPEFEAGNSLAVSDTNAGSANTNLQSVLARREIALRDVENVIAELQASVSQPLPPAVVEQVKSQLATNISAVEATAGFLQPLPANSPVKTFSVVPESQFDSFVLAPTPGTVRLYRGIGQEYSPTYGGPDPFFSPSDYVALEYARSNAVFGDEAQLLIADLDARVWSDLQAYRQVQSSLKERMISLGELSGAMQLPKDWFNPVTTKPSLVDDISGLGERYAREVESFAEERSNMWRQLRAEQERIKKTFQDANPGQLFERDISREARVELLKQDQRYVAVEQQYDALIAQEKNIEKVFAQKFAAERALRQGVVPTETNSILSLPAPTGERNFAFIGPTWNPKPNINTAVTPDVIALPGPAPIETPVWHRELPDLAIAAESNALTTLDSLSGVRTPDVTPTVEAVPRVPIRADLATGAVGVKSEFSYSTGVTTHYDTLDGVPFLQQKGTEAPSIIRPNGVPVQTSRVESKSWIYDTALALDRADKFDVFEEALIGQGWKIRDMQLLDDVTVQGTNVFGQSVTLSRDVFEAVRTVGSGVYDLDAIVSRIQNHTGGHLEFNGISEFPTRDQSLFSHEHGWVHPHQLALNTVRTHARLMEILTTEIEKYPSAFWNTVGSVKVYTYDKASAAGLTMPLGLGSRGDVPEMWLLPSDSPLFTSSPTTFHHELQHVVDRFFPEDEVWAVMMDYESTRSWSSFLLSQVEVAPRGYARAYGYRGGAVEDKATLVESMFHNYAALSQRAANDPILAKKIDAAKDVFFQLSDGQMNETYWTSLRPITEQNVLIATQQNSVTVPSVQSLPKVETPLQENQSYKDWFEFSTAASDSSLFALDSLSGARGPTIIPAIDMRPLVPRDQTPVLAPTTNAVQLELPLGNAPQPARQLEFDFGQNNTPLSTVGAVQGELPLAGNLGQQLELPFNQVAPAPVAQPAPVTLVSNVPAPIPTPTGLQPMQGTNYAYNPATNQVEEILTPLPGGGAGAGGTPPPNTGASGSADADAGGGFWSKAALETAKFFCYNGWIRMGACATLGAFAIASPDSQQNQAAAPKSNPPATPPKQNPPANQPTQKDNSDVNNPAQQAAPPAQQQTPPPDLTKQQPPADSLEGKVFGQDYYCIKSIEPVLVTTVPAGTAFPSGCLNGSHPSAGQVFDKNYYCITSIQPVIVKTIPAGTAFPANCYNGPNSQVPPPQQQQQQYVQVGPQSSAGNPNTQTGNTGAGSAGGLTGMFSRLLGQYLGQQLQQQQSQTQSQSSTPTTQQTTSIPKASVALVANPSTVQSGGTSTLWWASIRTSECLAYAPDGTQIGSAEESGMAEAVNVTQTSTYTVKCKGINGENVSASAQVTVAP